VETSLASGREILLGIARYVREHQPWLLYHEPRSLEDSLPQWLKGWKGQGIIARVQTPAMARAIAQTRLPVVDVLGVVEESRFPLVHVDDDAIGTLAARHLLERGFRHFAYLGVNGENWSAARQRAFANAVGERGFCVSVRNEPRHDLNDESWERHQEKLAKWVSGLPRSVGVMVCSDQRGSRLLEACRRAGLRVPDEVAVIGVDNDEPLCGVCNPALSSVWPGHEQVGFEAASLLERLMSGARHHAKRVFVSPVKVVTRQSTDILAVEDDAVARALYLIRERACERVRIDEIATLVGVSRSVLQRRFRATLGRTINDELIRQRVKIAQHLLLETKLTLIDIALRSGFQHQEYMGVIFKKVIGMTPDGWRRGG
jgi:LacI family transcriptional regulator